MTQWPRDDQRELIAFYGNPADRGPKGVGAQLVKVTPPFQMFYEGRPLNSLSFHRKAADALMAALTEIWDRYGHDQAEIDRLGISKCAGTYNPRKVRGSSTKWSNHAFGAAIDINAEENGFNAKSTIPLPVIAAFKRQGARWGGDYRGRKDPMHFEFCRNADESVGMADLPPADADTDYSPPPSHDVAPDADVPPVKQPWWKRAWAWGSGGGFSLAGLGIYDWRAAVALIFVALIVFLIVWFTFLRDYLKGQH